MTKYPWHRLIFPGDSFVASRRHTNERSLRANASKQAKRRSVVITVAVAGSKFKVKLVRAVL